MRELERYAGQLATAARVGSRRRTAVKAELLAHLLAIYDEELARAGDPWEAVSETKRRFGDPDTLMRELRSAGSFQEWWAFFFEAWEGVMGRWLWLVGATGVLVGMGFVMPAVAYLRRLALLSSGNPGNVQLSVSLLTLGLALALGGAAALLYGAVRLLRSRRA